MTRQEMNQYRQDAYMVIYGLLDLYLSEGNPIPEGISATTGRDYTQEMCEDLAAILTGFRAKFYQRAS